MIIVFDYKTRERTVRARATELTREGKRVVVNGLINKYHTNNNS
jgi:hypothetical protein